MLKGTLIYGQSGGPSAVINASAYGVIKEAMVNQEAIEEILVMKHGISGLINDDFYKLEDYVGQLELLPKTPASAFGSVRFKLRSYKEETELYQGFLEVFKKHNIRFFIYNGGNDSMDTCVKMQEFVDSVNYEMKIIGVPKTVDNDLPHTDHTPGFGSAAKFIINTLMQLSLDSTVYPTGKVTIVEIMGRHAGWLTAAAHVAGLHDLGADLVYLPEMTFDMDEFLGRVKEIYGRKQNCMIAVSEGIKDKDNNFIGMMNSFKDAFGHSQLGGVAVYLGDMIESKLKISYRAIELSSTQRSGAFIRSKSDVAEAIMVGRKAVQFALDGQSGKMVTINRVSNTPYTVEYKAYDVTQIANLEQVIPDSMMDGMNMTQEFYDYILPLIEGEEEQVYKDGVQQFFKLK